MPPLAKFLKDRDKISLICKLLVRQGTLCTYAFFYTVQLYSVLIYKNCHNIKTPCFCGLYQSFVFRVFPAFLLSLIFFLFLAVRQTSGYRCVINKIRDFDLPLVGGQFIQFNPSPLAGEGCFLPNGTPCSSQKSCCHSEASGF